MSLEAISYVEFAFNFSSVPLGFDICFLSGIYVFESNSNELNLRCACSLA